VVHDPTGLAGLTTSTRWCERPAPLVGCHVLSNAATDRLCEQVEKNPWWKNVKGPFPEQYGCVGVKPDGGGSMRGRGLVGKMNIHRAVNNRDLKAIVDAVEGGEDANEVEAVRICRPSHSVWWRRSVAG
jgi:hypothetical protein